MKESVVERSGSRIRLLRGGDGPPLLYLHGSGDGGAWLPPHDRLATRFDVIRPDLPGYNGSDPRSDARTVPGQAEAMWALLDQLGVADVRLVGSSLGGWVAAEMATALPARVTHLILLSPAGLPHPPNTSIDQFSMSDDELLEATYHQPQWRQQMRSRVAELKDDPVAAARLARNATTTEALGRHPYFSDPTLMSRLPGVTARTVVVCGAEDGLIPVECSQAYASSIPGARLVVLDDTGHLPLVERTDETLDLILPFLAT